MAKSYLYFGCLLCHTCAFVFGATPSPGSMTAELQVNDLPPGMPFHGYAGVSVSLTCSFTISPPESSVAYVRFKRAKSGSTKYEDLFEFRYPQGITPNFGSYDQRSISGFLSWADQSYTILLQDVTSEDSGQYKCLVSDTIGQVPSTDPVVTINLEPPPPCEPNPCGPGSCTVVHRSAVCRCPPGYRGIHCEQQEPCRDDPCGNGQCVETDLGYECHCDECFTGHKCDTVCVGDQQHLLKFFVALFIIATLALLATVIYFGIRLKRLRVSKI